MKAKAGVPWLLHLYQSWNDNVNRLILRSFAKVNIGLKILERRPDGYHNIHTIFQELDFHDKIILSLQADGCSLTVDKSGIPDDETNSCAIAYKIIKSHFPNVGGIKIQIEKLIPPGSGLGGGSSNAATVLKGLNKLYHLALDNKILETISTEIGADVPFFISGKTQVGDGVGNELEPIELVTGTYLLIIPNIFINTKWAYGKIKNHLNCSDQRPNFASFLKEGNLSFKFIQNDFEKIVIPAYPEIGSIKDKLSERGAKFTSLSGSGSTVFGIFDEEADAQTAQSYFQSRYQTVLTLPINH